MDRTGSAMISKKGLPERKTSYCLKQQTHWVPIQWQWFFL